MGRSSDEFNAPLRHHAGLRLRAHLGHGRVGILANNGILLLGFPRRRGAHFVELCCQRGIPLAVPAENIAGFMVGRKYEAGGIAKDGATSSPPSPAPMSRNSPSSPAGPSAAAITGMCGAPMRRASLHLAQFAYLGDGRGTGGQRVLATLRRTILEARGETWPAEAEEEFKRPIREKYEREGDPYYATARLWDDGIIDPADTRDVLGLAMAAALNAPAGETRFGVFRM